MNNKLKLELQCILTIEEKLAIGKALAAAQQKQSELKQRMKESAAQYKANIESEQSTIDEQAQRLQLGYEYRLIECEVKYHTPEEGKKTVVRLDTGVVETVKNMTNDELQDLFINGIGKKEDEHIFIFRDKRRCQLVTPEEFKTLQASGKFAKIGDGYTEKSLVDVKPAKIDIALVVYYAGDTYELWQFEKAAETKASASGKAVQK